MPSSSSLVPYSADPEFLSSLRQAYLSQAWVSQRREWRDAAKQAPLSQAPSWTASMSGVNHGDVYRTSSGILLIATQAAAGTAGTVEPAPTIGAAPGAITDGTITWWALSETTRPQVSGAVVATTTDVAGISALPNIYNVLDNASSFDQLSAANLTSPGGSGNTKYVQGWSFWDGTSATYGITVGGAQNNGYNGKYRTCAFDTAADLIEIGYIISAAASLNERIRVYVAGVGTTEVPVIPGATGASRFIRLSIPGGRRDRSIMVSCSGTVMLRYVGVAADVDVRKPSKRAPVAFWASDSFGDTAILATSPDRRLQNCHYDLAVRSCLRLGLPHVVDVTCGGTSYSAKSQAGARQPFKWILDNNDFSAYSPDVLINCHGYNAGTASYPVDENAEASAAAYCWSKQRNLFSSRPPLAVILPWYVRTGGDIALMQTVSAAIKQAFLAVRDQNSFVVDPLDGSITLGTGQVIRSARGAWFTSSVAAWAIGADGAHPSPAGLWMLTDRVVDSVEFGMSYLGA